MLRKPRIRWFVAIGILLIIAGAILPIRIPMWTEQHTFQMGQGADSSESVDIGLGLLFMETAIIDAHFGGDAAPNECIVWAIVNYQYPTKSIGETALRFEGERDVSFAFGWGNVRLLSIFVTGFVIRLFYFGPNQVSVDVAVTRVANVFFYGGVALLTVSVLMFVMPHIASKIREIRMDRAGGGRT